MNVPLILEIPQGPLIPGTVILESNDTILMRVSDSILKTFQSTSITISSTSVSIPLLNLQDGLLSGLTTPINDSDTANKNYIDTQYGNQIFNVEGTVQFRQGSSFSGSENLIFVNDAESGVGTLTIDGTIQSGTSTISGSKLYNIAEPITNDNPASKQYIDLLGTKYVNSISVTTSTTYTAAQVVNGVIIRSGLGIPVNTSSGFSDISVRTIDLFPTAQQIFNRLQQLGIFPAISTTFSFNIINVATNSSVSLIIEPFNDTVTFVPEIICINGGSQLSARGYITDINVPHVLLHLDSVNFVGTQEFVTPGLNDPGIAAIFNNDSGYSVKTFRTLNQMIKPMNPVEYPFGIFKVYTYDDLSRKLIIRGADLTANITDTFETAEKFLDQDFFIGYKSGLGMEFALQNVSSSYSVSLIPSTGWTFGNVSSITVGTGFTALMNVNVDGTNSALTVYLVGLFYRY